MISSIFLAPGRAALEVEAEYRKIWDDWMERSMKRIGFDSDADDEVNEKKRKILKELLTLAPIMKINGAIEIGLTMRIASIKEGKGGISLGTGPIGISGGYFKQSAEESVMSVRASFTLTNAELDLTGFLAKNGIELAKPGDVTRALELLKGDQKEVQ
jgi:hypothetical protein